jgi:nucleotide-binding universal stress UspA family protein
VRANARITSSWLGLPGNKAAIVISRRDPAAGCLACPVVLKSSCDRIRVPDLSGVWRKEPGKVWGYYAWSKVSGNEIRDRDHVEGQSEGIIVSHQNLASAAQDFYRARRQAALEEILARLTGKSNDLLCYEDVRQKLKARGTVARTLKDIPLDAIVGSVGRCADFTRSFLPRQDSDQMRWTRVEVGMTDLSGLPPIEVYQIGQAYFVLDGHHRVSVARQFGATHIQAYVIEIHTRVPLSPEVQPDDLIAKAEYADFLEHTNLDELRPEANLSVSVPGQYRALEDHIEVHRYLMGLEQKREPSYEEAAIHWYDEVYLPVVQAIRERGILRDFSERTEADLYLWLSEHRGELEEALGWEIRPEAAAADLAAQFSPKRERVVARVGEKILDAVTPDELEAGPPPGQWRMEYLAARRDDRLFADVLVAVSGEENGWHALEQALQLARREGAQLRGLHVVRSKAQRDSEATQAVRVEFNRRCEAASVPGKLSVEVGGVARKICDRAQWTDLVVLNLAHPPAPQPLARLGSGFRTLIRRCSRPVLAVPGASSPMDRALLAYDGSPKAEEALFVATYLAGRWQIPLVVVTVIETGRTTSEALARAQSYLEAHGVQATFVKESGPVAEAILKMAAAQESELIIMGGYGFSPVLEVVLGSAVDQVLRESRKPMLICR